MSGGIAYVYDPDRQLEGLSNVDVKGDLLPVEVRVVCAAARIGFVCTCSQDSLREEQGSVSFMGFGHGGEGALRQDAPATTVYDPVSLTTCSVVSAFSKRFIL
jgi:hypothetical protein